jgi:simple sugar transport system substrate-binding protein
MHALDRSVRHRSRRTVPATAAALTVLLAAVGCGAQSEVKSGDSADGMRVAVVSHSKPGDAFWDIVKNGAESAGRDLKVEVNYRGDPEPDKQAQLVEAAIAQKMDGIVVTLANPDAMKEPLEQAAKAKIPVITINSGQEFSAALKAITHVGQDEFLAGKAAGERMKAEGVKRMICVIHEAGNISLEQRCAGAAEALGGNSQNLQTDVSDVAGAANTIAAKLEQDRTVDGVLTLTQGMATAALEATKNSRSAARIGTFDLSDDIVAGIKDGRIGFAVDQQPYLQGYLPVSFLRLYKTNANTVGGGKPVLTGPALITKDNVDRVARLATEGTR